MSSHKIEELNQLYNDGESADQEIFAEFRSNLLLVAGDHYTRKGSKFWTRIRDNRQLSSEQKLRLTKNHIQRITKRYVNSITTYAPGVTVVPKHEGDLQSQKDAELNLSVWEDIKSRKRLKAETNKDAKDFIEIGEVACKIFFDPMAGDLIGWEAEMEEDPETGDQVPSKDENGQLIKSERPVFRGDFVYERIYGFNLIRDAGAKSMDESPWLCNRKMAKIKDVEAKIDASDKLNDEEKAELKQKLQESNDETYMVFDGSTSGYKIVKNQILLREFYFKPCPEYPNGYYYIATKEVILFDDELPFGIFPIIWAGFDEVQTSARCHSIVKQLRPNQIEINRAASKIAEHQITLGDDKLLVQNGSKITPGVHLPGVRSINYTGMAPTVLGGRSGEQYLDYMLKQIDEMDQIAMVAEMEVEKNGQLDPYALLFRSLKDKKQFSFYTDKFESFQVMKCEVTLKLAKKYLNEKHLVSAVGKRELINIKEFQTTDDMSFHIKLEPQTEDIESKMGKQLSINHVLQYVGNQLPKEDIGKLIRVMPYMNEEEIMEDMTMDYDVATNYILALERGTQPKQNKNDNHEYMIKRLTARQRQADYDFLSPKIQASYDQCVQYHENAITQKQMALKQAESAFIPSGGYQVACDLYVPNPSDPSKLPKRVRLPSESIQWLIGQLNSQGSSQQSLAGLPGGAQQDIASQISQQLGAQKQGQVFQLPQKLAQRPAPGGLNGSG